MSILIFSVCFPPPAVVTKIVPPVYGRIECMRKLIEIGKPLQEDTCEPTTRELVHGGYPSGRSGAAGELVVAAELLRSGFEVYRALSPNAKFDLLILNPVSNVVFPISVKSGSAKGRTPSDCVLAKVSWYENGGKPRPVGDVGPPAFVPVESFTGLESVAEMQAKFNVSRKTAYKWLRKSPEYQRKRSMQPESIKARQEERAKPEFRGKRNLLSLETLALRKNQSD